MGKVQTIILSGVSSGVANQVIAPTPSSDQSLDNDGTIAVTASNVRVAGNGAAVTLDTDPAIADGSYDGQWIVIKGTHDTNTVTIADACNTRLQGGTSVTLGLGDTLFVMWDAGDSLWDEVSRSDN